MGNRKRCLPKAANTRAKAVKTRAKAAKKPKKNVGKVATAKAVEVAEPPRVVDRGEFRNVHIPSNNLMPPKKSIANGNSKDEMEAFIGAIVTHKGNSYRVGELLGVGGSAGGVFTIESDDDKVVKIVRIKETARSWPSRCEAIVLDDLARPQVEDSFNAYKRELSYFPLPLLYSYQEITMSLAAEMYDFGPLDVTYSFTVTCRLGSSLHTMLRTKHFTVLQVFQIAYAICCALQYIHAKDYTHLDIQPSNIMLSGSEYGDATRIYLVDFAACTKSMPSIEDLKSCSGMHRMTRWTSRLVENYIALAITETPTCKGNEPAWRYWHGSLTQPIFPPRADMESLSYTMLTLLTADMLPWDSNGDMHISKLELSLGDVIPPIDKTRSKDMFSNMKRFWRHINEKCLHRDAIGAVTFARDPPQELLQFYKISVIQPTLSVTRNGQSKSSIDYDRLIRLCKQVFKKCQITAGTQFQFRDNPLTYYGGK